MHADTRGQHMITCSEYVCVHVQMNGLLCTSGTETMTDVSSIHAGPQSYRKSAENSL